MKPTALEAGFGFAHTFRCEDCGFDSKMMAEKIKKKKC